MTAFSQTNTKITTDSVVILPKNVAKEVVKDIIRKDSCEAELTLVKKNLDLMGKTNNLKDSIILSMKSQILLHKTIDSNYNTMLNLKDVEIANFNTATAAMKKDLKETKRKLAATKIGAGVIILALVVLIFK